VDEIISTALTRAEPITRNHHVELNVEKELPGVRVDERAVSEVVYPDLVITDLAMPNVDGPRWSLHGSQ
jgi:hypothetical protein